MHPTRLIAFILVLVTYFAASTVSAASMGVTKKVYVSAYYTPLSGQTSYLHGSYAAELRANGGNTTAANGTRVYVGMLAAPRTYAFGTRIEIPTLGVGTVHDRGGWIANATLKRRAYDRIDVWMGEGDAGLARAKKWGVRLLTVTIYTPPTDIAESIRFE